MPDKQDGLEKLYDYFINEVPEPLDFFVQPSETFAAFPASDPSGVEAKNHHRMALSHMKLVEKTMGKRGNSGDNFSTEMGT